MYAVERGSVDIINRLLELGADPMAADNYVRVFLCFVWFCYSFRTAPNKALIFVCLAVGWTDSSVVCSRPRQRRDYQ